MSGVVGGRGLLAAAALAIASMPLSGVSVPDLRMAPPAIGYAPPSPGRMRVRTAGKHLPAGAKLWRKAREGKLGVRW